MAERVLLTAVAIAAPVLFLAVLAWLVGLWGRR